MSLRGALRFGRYAFPPNQLGYCGPPDHMALLEYVSAGAADDGLVDLERRFEGAYPYLVLVATANGIPDPFDDRVVEAYWIGNRCLDRVDPGRLYAHLGDRFRTRMNGKELGSVTAKVGHAAVPHHNFHVFDIYVRTGLLRDHRSARVLETMDSCRVSWGTVTAVAGDELLVDRSALTLTGGKLALGEPRATRVTRQHNGYRLAGDPAPGDTVSIHWRWACDVLTPAALSSLRARTRHCLALANETI